MWHLILSHDRYQMRPVVNGLRPILLQRLVVSLPCWSYVAFYRLWQISEWFSSTRVGRPAMIPPELENDFVKSTTGIAGLGVRIGLLDVITLGAIARNFPCWGSVGVASLVVAVNCLCCALALGIRDSSEDDEEDNFLCLFSFFPQEWFAGSLMTWNLWIFES